MFLDIETSPMIGYSFNYYDTTMSKILQPSFILMAGYRWGHEKKTHVIRLCDFKGYKKNKTDDKELCKFIAELYEQADLVVAHNGKNFDIKVINTRFLINGLEPPKLFKTYDTKNFAKSKFRFYSNSLKNIAIQMGTINKLENEGIELWHGVMNGDMKKWEIMTQYCKRDVDTMKAIFDKFRPWDDKLDLQIYNRNERICPSCRSTNFVKYGVRYTKTKEIQTYKCECGRRF